MAGLNLVQILGNVGRDPEMRYTSGGTAVTSFSIAVSRRWTKDGQQQEETEWFNVVAWDKLAETCNQLITKGRKVYIQGRLQTRSWEGQDGQKKYRTEVVAQQMLLVDSKPQNDGRGDSSRDAGQQSSFGDELEPDDIPF